MTRKNVNIYKVEFIGWSSDESAFVEFPDKKLAIEHMNGYKKHYDFKIARVWDKLDNSGKPLKEIDCFTREWIIEKAIPIVTSTEDDFTLRGLHYRLVALGMSNTIRHYKRVVAAMTEARWQGLISFDSFKDHEREKIGNTHFRETDVITSTTVAKRQIQLWMSNYTKNRWENQDYYIEVFIEKKALQGVFEPICRQWDVALNPCKGYPSLTFLQDAKERFEEADLEGKTPIILYFGDYDPTGEDIPRSIQETISKMGVAVDMQRILLTKEQVIEMELPPAPTKDTDTRSNTWDGLGQVELDAVMPEVLKEMCADAIKAYFDFDKYSELIDQQEEEETEYKAILKEFVSNL